MKTSRHLQRLSAVNVVAVTICLFKNYSVCFLVIVMCSPHIGIVSTLIKYSHNFDYDGNAGKMMLLFLPLQEDS